MDSLTIHLHSGATHPRNWRTKGRSVAHLRKGDVSGSISGYLSACMALVVLGVTSRSHIRSAYAVPDGKLQEFFAAGLESSFGLDAKGMAHLLGTVGRFVRSLRLRGRRDWLIHATLARLSEGEVCVIALGDSGFQYCEWRTVVGVEWRSDTTGHHPMALLVLDSTAPIGRIAAFNGRLELADKPDARCMYYTTNDGDVRTVTLKYVFSLKKRTPWT